jgi:hypothetical protein
MATSLRFLPNIRLVNGKNDNKKTQDVRSSGAMSVLNAPTSSFTRYVMPLNTSRRGFNPHSANLNPRFRAREISQRPKERGGSFLRPHPRASRNLLNYAQQVGGCSLNI